MLSTAIEILEATKDSIFDEDIMGLAGELHTRRNELSDEIFAKYLFMYSSAVASKVADSVTKILLTAEEMSALCDTIREMDDLSETILEENE
jgi:Trp operon repressor